MGVASLGKDHTWEINLAARAAWMSYVGNLTQSEIASRLGVSSARVHRLIQLAKQHGIIRISIEGRPAECMHLEAEVAAQFQLKSCTISPFLSDKKDNQDLASLAVGQAAGQVLAQHILLPSTKSIAIDPFGTTLTEAVRSIPQISKPALQVWPTYGCISRDFQSVSSPVLSTMEMRTKAEIGLLPVPYAPASTAEADSFEQLKSVQDLLTKASAANVVVGQIQTADHLDEVTPPEYATHAVAAQAHSRFLGTYFDKDGAPVEDDHLRSISLPLNALRDTTHQAQRRIFALAAGPGLKGATLSALRTDLITDLLIEEELAQALLS
jgi:DNA-binding transcriptional regulator LsrR (DeoR family)